MLTDWGWVFLADMAPFKPVYLPSNNPSEFYFFFNISGKDHPACYLAPERFVDSINSQINVSDAIGTKSSVSKKTESSVSFIIAFLCDNWENNFYRKLSLLMEQ